jgi:hypothetical protein
MSDRLISHDFTNTSHFEVANHIDHWVLYLITPWLSEHLQEAAWTSIDILTSEIFMISSQIAAELRHSTDLGEQGLFIKYRAMPNISSGVWWFHLAFSMSFKKIETPHWNFKGQPGQKFLFHLYFWIDLRVMHWSLRILFLFVIEKIPFHVTELLNNSAKCNLPFGTSASQWWLWMVFWVDSLYLFWAVPTTSRWLKSTVIYNNIFDNGKLKKAWQPRNPTALKFFASPCRRGLNRSKFMMARNSPSWPRRARHQEIDIMCESRKLERDPYAIELTRRPIPLRLA